MKMTGEFRKHSNVFAAATLLLFGAALCVAAQNAPQNDETSSEACTKSAWELYNKKDYTGAAKKARSCIYFFQGKAWDLEKELEGKETLPPTGEVPDEKERQKIFKRGQLNDVATGYFIVGSSYEHLYLKKTEAGSKKDDEDKSAAIEAYKSACKYKYARTAETNLASFWSPAQESSYALQRLGSQCP
ncbi:MAG TPA: hypothetical protein VNY51_05935 [Candidatus Dormibacteraeota bacterium]|jgi:hypothetical protein|nr:hypothetical protein [Candidatus Dormibacteraeota bacterium]